MTPTHRIAWTTCAGYRPEPYPYAGRDCRPLAVGRRGGPHNVLVEFEEVLELGWQRELVVVPGRAVRRITDCPPVRVRLL